jgi:UDP-N-acetylmuramate dehydrogenase
LKILNDISLRRFNTFSLDVRADFLIFLEKETDAVTLFDGSKAKPEKYFLLGGGSNILFIGNFAGTILHPVIADIKTEEKHSDYVLVSAGSGVIWDTLVEWSVSKGYGGLENLSMIPGTVGASAVQNIGAYGAEVKDTIEKIRTVSTRNGSIREFSKSECGFDYRNSVFKSEEKEKYIITRVYYRLTLDPVINLKYGSLEDEVKSIGMVTLKNVRHAVINIRRSKLPDPGILGNAGSFFKNPVVSNSFADSLRKSYIEAPLYIDNSGSTKLSAAWLIDQCGWKGKRIGETGVHDKHSLVLVNYGKATGRDIYNLSEEIKNSVRDKFSIELEREVEIVGTI